MAPSKDWARFVGATEPAQALPHPVGRHCARWILVQSQGIHDCRFFGLTQLVQAPVAARYEYFASRPWCMTSVSATAKACRNSWAANSDWAVAYSSS